MPNPSTPGDALADSHLPIVAAATLLCVMLAGFWQFSAACLEFADMKIPTNWADFREGRSTTTLEKQIDQHLPAKPTLIAAANTARYLLTRGAGEQVRIGRADWLFLTEELRYDAQGSQNMARRVQLLQQAGQMLAQKGVELVLVLVPDKARVHPEHWSASGYPPYNAQRYRQALQQLRQAGVKTVDLLTPLQQAAQQAEVYYRTDTHWNQLGAKVAAQTIATNLLALGAKLDETSFATHTEAAPVERAGDLIRLMGLESTPNWLRPKPDLEAPQATRQTSADTSLGLFGDAAVAVVLTGTSYSLRGNFHGQLQQALSSKILNVAKDGGGFLQATGSYLNDESFLSTPPKVLLWEVPERFLTLPLDQETTWLDSTHLSSDTGHRSPAAEMQKQ